MLADYATYDANANGLLLQSFKEENNSSINPILPMSSYDGLDYSLYTTSNDMSFLWWWIKEKIIESSVLLMLIKILSYSVLQFQTKF